MHDKEKQVEQLLVNANQSLNFLRTVLDDLLTKKEDLKFEIRQRIFISQKNYKVHKAVLTNTQNLLSKKKISFPDKLLIHLANNLRKRITIIIEEAIELDRLR